MADLWLEPFEEAIAEFPVTGSPPEKFASALRFAARAPSVHNTQPWWCRVRQGRLEVHADRRRQLRLADPDGREMVASCGALVEHLWVALRRFGHDARVEAFPEGPGSDFLARLDLGELHRVDPSDRHLFEAIPNRVTNRRAFQRRAVPELALERASRRAIQRRARLGVLRDPAERAVLADLVSEADRRQMASREFREELASWLRPLGSQRRDGIPAYAGKAPAAVRPVAPLLVRTFDMGDGAAAYDRRLATGSPVLAVLWTPTDTRAAWLDAGRALARVLLSLTADGIATSFLNQPIEVPELRVELAQALGPHEFPQMVLRMGYGPTLAPTPRRSIKSILRS